MIKTIIFDWSGTLLDSSQAFYETCKIMFPKLGKECPSQQEIKENFSIPYMTFWNKYFPDLTIEQEKRLFKEAVCKVTKPHLHPGVKQLLTNLQNQSIRVMVLSSESHAKLIFEARENHIFHLFTDTVTDVHHKTDAIMELLDDYQLDPKETLFVGGTSGDIESGKLTSTLTAGVSWGLQDSSKVQAANPDFFLNNLSTLHDICNEKP
ncbi:HAD family hydrolase [Nanoarchaeota archaeon]